MAKPKAKSSQRPSRRKGKGTTTAKKKKMSKNQAAEDPAAAPLQVVKALRESYNLTSSPIAWISKRLDKSVQANGEPIDKIILTGIALSPGDMYAISNTFSTYASLKFVCLWNLKTDNRILGALAALLANNEGIQTLSVIDCGISQSDSLTRICQESKSLKNLVFDHNPLGSMGANQILAGIRRNKNEGVQKLSLKYCHIDHTLCDNLGYTLQTNTTLTEIDMTGNQIKDGGLTPIANALATNTTLQILNLAANGIAESYEVYGVLSAKDLAINQENENPAITLNEASRDIEGLIALCDVLARRNTGLGVLDLQGNHIGEQATIRIKDMLKERKHSMSSIKACPLVCHVSERVSEELFTDVLELNAGMSAQGSKGKKGKK